MLRWRAAVMGLLQDLSFIRTWQCLYLAAACCGWRTDINCGALTSTVRTDICGPPLLSSPGACSSGPTTAASSAWSCPRTWVGGVGGGQGLWLDL